MTRRSRVCVALASSAAVFTAAGAAFATTSPTPGQAAVDAATLNGTRTLSITDLAGNPLGPSSGIAVGLGHAGKVVVDVTDANYQHLGFEVDSTMTNLYPFSATTGYDFTGTPIPSSAVSMTPNKGDLLNPQALIAPVFNLAGTLDATALTGSLTGTQITFPAVVNTTVIGIPNDYAQLSGYISDLTQDAEPMRVTPGANSPNTFTSPDALQGHGGSASPSHLIVMSGAAHDPSNLTNDVLSWIENNSKVGKATPTAADLVAAGFLDENTLLSAVAQQLGLNDPSLLDPSVVLGALTTTLSATPLTQGGTTTTLDTIAAPTNTSLQTSVLGQSGVYTQVPTLTVDTSHAAPGTYRGVLTVTLMDNDNTAP